MLPKPIEKAIILLSFTLPIFIFVFAFCFLLLIKRVPGFHQDEVGELVPIYKGQSLTQTLTLEQSGLDTILIFLKNASLKNQDKFIFQIENREIIINGYNIGDGETVKFQFPPLNLPVGSHISFTLLAPDTKNPNLAIQAGISKSDAYKAGSLQGQYSPRDLSFQLFYQPQSKQQLLKQQLALFFSRI